MKNYLQNNKVVFLISIAISIVMWWSISYHSTPFTKGEEYSRKIANVKVQATYSEEEFELSQNANTINVTLTGNKFILDYLPSSSYRAFIDLRGLGPGKHRNIPIQIEGLPINVQKEVYPSTMDVELKKKIQKEVPVHVDVIGKVAEGYQIESILPQPDTVVIKGTESKLSKVTQVKAVVNVANAKEPIQKSVKLGVYGQYGEIDGVHIYPETVEVSIFVQSLSKKVPLSIGIEKPPPPGYRIGKIGLSQDSVAVYGMKSYLDQLFIYEGNKLDLSKVTATTTFHLPIKRHKKAFKIEPNKVSVTVEVIPVG